MDWRKIDDRGRVIVWCKTQQEVDDFMDIAEYEGIFWNGGNYPHLKDHVDGSKPNVEYHIYQNNSLCYDPFVSRRKNATVLGSDLHNYAISVRLKRGDTCD